MKRSLLCGGQAVPSTYCCLALSVADVRKLWTSDPLTLYQDTCMLPMLCSLIHILCGNKTHSCVKMTPVYRIYSWPDVKRFIEPWMMGKYQFVNDKITLAVSTVDVDIYCLCWWTVMGLLSSCWFWIFISAWLLQEWLLFKVSHHQILNITTV